MIRVAVIGVGGMGACHARNIADLAGAELGWIADPAPDALELATELGAKWTADGMDTLDDVDAVVVACPDRFHGTYTLAAIERGLPVLCEKPLTVELEEAQSIIDAELKHGRSLVQLGFMRQYDDAHDQLAQAVANLGEINHIRCVHRNTNEAARSVPQMLVESMIHDINSVRWISGAEIIGVHTSVVNRDRGAHFVLLACELSNGGVATIEFDDAAAGYEVGLEVSAELGNVVAAEPLRARVRQSDVIAETIGQDWFVPFLGAYRVEMRAWLDSITAERATGSSAWDGFAAQKVVEAAAASAANGTPERVVLPPKPSLYQGVR